MKKYIIYLVITLLVIIGSCSKDEDSSWNNDSTYNATGEKNFNSSGKSGSMARIITKGNYLYAVDNTSIKVVDISNPTQPKHVNTVEIEFGIETIYPFKDYLFIGSNIGMYIYGLSNPEAPNQLSKFEHISACDPVIADDTIAFVTLRNNEICNRFVDTRQIDAIDVSDVFNPKLITTYNTEFYPYGLDRTDEHLFVCHGEDGLVVYDIKKLVKNQQASIARINENGINAFDAIIWQNKLFVIGESGFYQFDYSDINNISLISSILTN